MGLWKIAKDHGSIVKKKKNTHGSGDACSQGGVCSTPDETGAIG